MTMKTLLFRSCFLASLLLAATASGGQAPPRSAPQGTHVTINPDQVLIINGRKVFPIGFTIPPPPDGKTPDGTNAIAALHDAGATFLRTGAQGSGWNATTLAREDKWQAAAARNGMYCWVYLRETASIGPQDTAREAKLRLVVNRYKDSPGMGVWKGVDEPEWGKRPLAPMLRTRQIIRALDPNHPLALIQAPRGTVDTLRPYNAAADIIGADIYPISYPPGIHSLRPNKEISMVGDYTQTMLQTAGGHMPVWMVLQIAWSGVAKPGRTLRFPTLPQERFMAYQAIINGAHGLFFFGGQLPQTLNAEDAKLGWNWTFWRRVLCPVVAEIGWRSPLYPALIAPNSSLPVQVSDADGMEFCVRQVGGDLFLLACKREGATAQVEFSGLPQTAATGDVLFEEPRRVTAQDGRFRDWFAPFDVHVYRFSLSPPKERVEKTPQPGPGRQPAFARDFRE